MHLTSLALPVEFKLYIFSIVFLFGIYAYMFQDTAIPSKYFLVSFPWLMFLWWHKVRIFDNYGFPSI